RMRVYRYDLVGGIHSSRGPGKWEDPMDRKRALPGHANQRTGRFQHDIDVPGARHGMGIPRPRRYLHSLATDVYPARHPTKSLIDSLTLSNRDKDRHRGCPMHSVLRSRRHSYCHSPRGSGMFSLKHRSISLARRIHAKTQDVILATLRWVSHNG